MTESKRDLFMEWFQRFGTTLRDDEYEGIIEALVEHDRQVAERAWDDCRQFAYDIWADDALDQQIGRANPHRAAREQ